MNDANRYNAIEETLQIINGEYISLPPDEIRSNNEVLDELLEALIEGCKETNELFSDIYKGVFYGGSYYDGLKIRRPDEYDIDFKFSIPYNDEIFPSNSNGYVNLRITRVPNNDPQLWNIWRQRRRPYYGEPGLHLLINDDDYLDTDKVMLWMHQTLSVFLGGRKRGKVRISELPTSRGIFELRFIRRGPAFTFRASNFEGIKINFDLVPCFVFGEDQWPTNGFRPNPVPEKPEFFIIPKPLVDSHIGTRYWRLSFQEQERVILLSKGKLKPTLRILKKMRDKLQHDCIKSYFIKTVLLWEAFEIRRNDDAFWDMPLSYVFMNILEDYENCIRNGIRYFWYRRLNLIELVDNETLNDISMELTNIIEDIEDNPDNKLLVAKYLLSNRELRDFKRKYPHIR